jgi:hypothetical protein
VHSNSTYVALPCPMCGKPDSARMGNTQWGHTWSCCSDTCGRAFEVSSQRWAKELEVAEYKLALLREDVTRFKELLAKAKDREADALLDHVMDVGQ